MQSASRARRRSLTVEGYLSRWLLHIEKARRPKTYALYEALIRNHVLAHIGSLQVASLQRHHIRFLLDTLSGAVGDRTCQLVHRVLRYAFGEAVEDGLLLRNPCARRDKPKYEPAPRRTLSPDEADRLLRAAKMTPYHSLFYVALVTGMRQGEIFGLRWDCVDLESAYIYVRATLTRDKENEAHLSPPKASRQRRIDLGPTTVAILREYKASQPSPSAWVFTDLHGAPLQKDAFVRGVFHRLLKAAQLPRIRFHDLRHTSATLALASGLNVKVISERLGHASAKMTLDVYTRALPTLQREAADRMEDIIGRG
ncbi:MAG: site-specific integrase [Candidatus Eremiobacteraeota bacterium]|nr:site-specific integrase [Candidatus Eremiobacteraeota bacterium]